MALRKQPLRQCVGCQQQREKRSMLRIVLATDGTISLDPSGRRAGRGAYICPDAACFQLAKKRKALDRGLKTSVPTDVYDRLAQAIAQAADG